MSLPADQQIPEDQESLLVRISTEHGRKEIIAQQNDRAEFLLTLLQEVLDAPNHDRRRGAEVRATVLKVMISLAKQSDTIVESGGYGDIYKRHWRGQDVALKFPHTNQDPKKEKQFFQEALLWRQLSHQHILPFLGLYQDGPRKAMVSRWKGHGNIIQYLQSAPDADRYKLLIQATDGLTYLHEHEPPVIHSDLKPENILIDDDGTALLADFGLTRVQHALADLKSSTQNGGTYCYTSPERLTENPTKFSDIWALGMVALEVFAEKKPYSELGPGPAVITAIHKEILPQKPTAYIVSQRGFTGELWNFLKEVCWAKAPEDRQTARNCRRRLKYLKSQWAQEKLKSASSLEDNVEVQVSVSPRYARRDLGALEKQFGVKIQKDKKNMFLKIVGKQLNVEAAETKVHDALWAPSHLHGILMGPKGESVLALEKEYKVKIEFAPNQVNIEGPSHGVAEAKARLRVIIEKHRVYDDALELAISPNVSRLIQADRQKILTDIGCDLRDFSISDARVKMRGPRNALQSVQTYIHQLQERFESETILTLTDNFHLLRPLISGQIWSDIVLKCGGPSDPELQKRLVILSQKREEILLCGKPTLLQALKQELDLEVDRRRIIVMGMEIPHTLHDFLREHDISGIQNETHTLIFLPGTSRGEPLPEPVNHKELSDSEAVSRDIVRVSGTLDACTAALQLLENRVKEEKRLRRKLSFHVKYHHEVHDIVMPKLTDMGIRIVLPTLPLRPLSSPIPGPQAAPRSSQPSWELIRRYDLEDTEDCTWALRASTEDNLDDGHNIVKEAVKRVSAASYLGHLTFPANSDLRQIIGSRGETVQHLQDETNTRMTVPPLEGTSATIEIIGSKKNVELAKDKILGLLDAQNGLSQK